MLGNFSLPTSLLAQRAVGEIHELVTVCVTQTRLDHSRKAKLVALLKSIRSHYDRRLNVLVMSGPSDTEEIRSQVSDMGAQNLILSEDSGVSAGRNAMVQAVRTKYVAMIDDDVVFTTASSLQTLLSALRSFPKAGISGGCYVDAEDHSDNCYRNMQFQPSEDGAVVHAKQLHGLSTDDCHRVSATQNFFVAPTWVLRRFQWDARQRLMEHETFFYQLYLNAIPVITCPGISVIHNRTATHNISNNSSRSLKQGYVFQRASPYVQYLCHNFPEVRRFLTPYIWWLCDHKRFCHANLDAEFIYDGRSCQSMVWHAEERISTVPRQLVDPFQPRHVFAPVRSKASRITRPGIGHRLIPLLILIFTRRSNFARREEQRRGWLSFSWHRGPTEIERVPWRYLYVYAASSAVEKYDQIIGDGVTLSRVQEKYSRLVYKTMEAMQWALANVEFEFLLKTDDDSIVHVGRVWHWVNTRFSPEEKRLLYAGRTITSSQVIRPNFTRQDLKHAEWYPDGFKRWAVEYSKYRPSFFPTYCSGGGYIVGRDAVHMLVESFRKMSSSRVFRLEDAFLGVLAQREGIIAREMPGVTDLLLDKKHPQIWNNESWPRIFSGKLLVHRVAHPLLALRWIMLSDDHLNEWSQHETFQRADCSDCELAAVDAGKA